MALYKECPHCGANLDPGETCNCQDEKHKAKIFYENITSVDADGQYTFNLGANDEETRL